MAAPAAEQDRLVQSLLLDMEARRVHPTIRKRLQTNGWQHPMVLHEMVRFYATTRIGDGWDQPTPEQLLDTKVLICFPNLTPCSKMSISRRPLLV